MFRVDSKINYKSIDKYCKRNVMLNVTTIHSLNGS